MPDAWKAKDCIQIICFCGIIMGFKRDYRAYKFYRVRWGCGWKLKVGVWGFVGVKRGDSSGIGQRFHGWGLGNGAR